MAKILVAASPEPRIILERVLAGHELCCAETMAQAEELLHQQAFDLILCTIVFDDSRMFDLLRLAKGTPQWQGIPFACARIKPDVLSPIGVEGVAFTCRALGTSAFLDTADYKLDPERELRTAIEQLLETKPNRTGD